jgi:glycosyltransferase involved in cell wall biosynthesis
MTTISIAMATYNGARFIREQLDSLAAQSVLPSQLVISDDGSTDKTVEIVTEFARNAPFPVRVLGNDRRIGFRANFMKCANLCNGTLIAFCDQDDVWHEHKLRILAKHFDDPDVLLACHNVALVDEHRRDLGETVHKIDRVGKSTLRDLLPFAYSHGFTQMFRRDLLPFSKYWEYSADCVQPDQPMAHDQFYVFVAMLLGYVYYENQILASYRQHGHNATGNIVVHSTLDSVRAKLLSRTNEYEKIAFLARNRLQLVCMISSDTTLTDNFPKARTKFKEATILYNSFLESVTRRLELYSSDSIPKKLSAFTKILVFGDYKVSLKNNWGFTIVGALRDLSVLLYVKV